MPTVTVSGLPQSQGNLRRSPSGGTYETNKAARPWKLAIAAAVDEFRDGAPATREPVQLFARFYFVRPASHLKKSGGLAAGAPRAMVRNPDIDKLCRAVLDALTGTLYADDSQVVQLAAVKRYGDRARLELSFDIVPADEPAIADETVPAAAGAS